MTWGAGAKHSQICLGSLAEMGNAIRFALNKHSIDNGKVKAVTSPKVLEAITHHHNNSSMIKVSKCIFKTPKISLISDAGHCIIHTSHTSKDLDPTIKCSSMSLHACTPSKAHTQNAKFASGSATVFKHD